MVEAFYAGCIHKGTVVYGLNPFSGAVLRAERQRASRVVACVAEAHGRGVFPRMQRTPGEGGSHLACHTNL